MGRSASKLSSTRSGVVSARFLVAGIGSLAFTTPIPPLTLVGRQFGILRLFDSCAEGVETADVDGLALQRAQLLVELLRIPARELRNAVYAEHLEVAQHRGTDRNQIG